MPANLPSPIDHTHDPKLTSWVESANDPGTDFPIQNLPLCAFEKSHDGHTHAHLGVAIGDQVLDLTSLVEAGQFDDDEDLAEALTLPYWVAISDDPEARRDLRERLQKMLRSDAPAGQQARRQRQKSLQPIATTRFLPPLPVFNYTDFYASKHHATNVGSMFRPDNPLLPNYVHVPIGYHGRASSVIVSGEQVRRPRGQTKADDAAAPSFGPSKMLDYELELGLYIGAGNELGMPIPIEQAAEHALGVCLLNDWSARDFQKWEYQPLGPFLAKNFATTVSPFIVTIDALAPCFVDGPERGSGDPEPLEYLRTQARWGLDLTVEVWLSSSAMREKGAGPVMISRGNAKHLFWTFAQMIAHHTSNGCNLQTGDLLGSGTISGPEKSSRGCLLELTFDGNDPATGKPKPRTPIALPTGETRTFLADGDEVILRGYAQPAGYRRIGLGECRGIVQPALT